MASLAVKARMRTSAAGSNPNRGFTLLELLVVVAIMAIATAGVGLALRDSSRTMLEREAQRLMALLESARAQSRMSANPIRWRTTDKGFFFDGAATDGVRPFAVVADAEAVPVAP
jgi:general secretion pathway protein H